MASPRSPARRDSKPSRSVPRITVPTRKEFLSTIVEASQPVIIEGALDGWELRSPPLSKQALLDRLAALSGKREVNVATASRANKGLFSYAQSQTRGQNYAETTKHFGAFLEDLTRDGPALYMRSAPVRDTLPELLPLFQLELLRDPKLIIDTPRLWIGNGGHRLAMHYDRDDNLLCMVAGRKRVMLYPPTALPSVYIGGFGFEPGGTATAMVDPLHPDLERFPRFREVEQEVVVAEVAAGDALYIPAHWWHHVESFDLNVAVTFWWCRTPMEARLAAEACLVHGLLALRTLPVHLRSVYRTMFDYFVFEQHGDPYAHVEEAVQGWAGRPTPKRVRGLRDKLRQLLGGSGVMGERSSVDLSHRHALVTGLSFRVSEDNIEMRGDFEFPLVIPYELFELLREFRSPIAPTKLAKKRHPRSASDRHDLEQICRAMVVRGLLVDCEVTERGE